MRVRLTRRCAQTMKYRNVEDYVRSIREVDAMQMINMRMCILDLRCVRGGLRAGPGRRAHARVRVRAATTT